MSTNPQPLFDMSKAKPIFDMSKAKPIEAKPTEAQQVSAGLPGIPAPPSSILQAAQPQERAMQQGMGGPPQMVDVPQGEGQAFTQAGQAGAQTGGKIGMGLLAATTPISSLTGAATGYATGKGAKYGAKALGAGPGGQEAAEDVGNVAGSALGYGLPGLVKRGIQSLAYEGGDLSPAAKLLFHHPTEALFKTAFPPPPEAAVAPKLSPFEGATSSSAPVGSAELPKPSTTSTTNTGGGKITPPPNISYVQKFGAPEKGLIVDPNSPPPPVNKTLVSYPGEQLLQMAKRGDIDAINELMRNPRGINLREALPNVKFLMEQGRSTRIYGGPGSGKTLLPAVGIVGSEFSKLGLQDPVNPRQQTTLETMMRGPKWKDLDGEEKMDHIRDILGRK